MSHNRTRFIAPSRRFAARPILTSALALAASATLPTVARAATSLIVTTTADEDNGTSDPIAGTGTSLREALIYANSNPDASTITFDLPGSGPHTITLLSALPNIIDDTNFDNSGAIAKAITVARSSATGTPIFNIFTIFRNTTSGPTVTISALTLSNGNGNPNNGGGGAIFNALGALTINNCTISNNSANFGGAIVNSGGTLVVNNSTFSGNRALGSDQVQDGGGVLDTFGGAVTFTSCTLTNNAAPNVASGVRGGLWLESGTLTLRNTIVAGNVVQDIQRDNNGVLVSQGFNLIGLTNDVGPFTATDQLGITAPLLGALANNGGLSATHALLPGSLAVNAGDPMITSGVDQRGLPRVRRGRADIGAYEVQNGRPSAANFTKTLNEDSTLILAAADFTGAFSDPENDALSKIRITALPTNGALQLNGVAVAPGQEIAAANLGGLTYAPTANLNGVDSLTYNAADAFGFGANDATITLQVLAVNDAPSFTVGAGQTVNEDSGLQVLAGFISNIAAGPVDESAQTVAFTVTNDNNALFSVQPAIASDGTLSYTPATNASGSASVLVILQDDGGTSNGGVNTSAGQIFTITVNAQNDAPLNSVPGAQSTREDSALIFNAANANLLSVSDLDNTALSITLSVTNGTLTLSQTTGLSFSVGDGTSDATLSFSGSIAAINAALAGLSFNPTANFNGGATLTLVSSDGSASDSDTVALQVLAVNDAPSFTVGAGQTVNEDSGPQVRAGFISNIAAGPVDESAQTVAFTVTNNNNALFSAQPAIASDGTLSYTPATNANGSASVLVILQDDGGTANGGVNTSAGQTFTLQVLAVNDAPVASDQTVATNEDTPASLVLSATDVENEALSYQLVTAPAHGTLSGTAPNLTYTPAANFNGADAFTFQANDGKADSNLATVTLQVLAVNDAPIAQSVTVPTREDTPVSFALGAADADNDALSFTIVNGPQNGTLSGVAPNLIYTPNANFNGLDTLTFRVNDGQVASNLATVTLQVLAVNNAPIADNQQLNADNATPLNITLSATDVDNDALSFAVTSNPQHGTLAGSAPNLTYTANAGFRGSDGFTFIASDGTATSQATVTIIVSGDAAVQANDDAFTLVIGAPGQAQQAGVVFLSSGIFQISGPGVLRNDSFPDAKTASARAISNPKKGRYQLRRDGTLFYVPYNNQVGVDEFSYALSDGKTTATAKVRLNIIDQRAPELAFDTPRDRATLQKFSKIAGRVRDRNSGVKSVTLLWRRFDGKFWNGSAWGMAATELPTVVQGIGWAYQGAVPAPGANPATDLLVGRYDLRATVTDGSDNLKRIVNRIIVTAAAAPAPEFSTVRLSSATATPGSIVLNFTGALDAASASDAMHYALAVNGKAIEIGAASYANNVVTLSGFELKAGDAIELRVEGLRDAGGKAVRAGTLNLITR